MNRKAFVIFALVIYLFCTFSQDLISLDKPITILISLDGFRWDYIDKGYSPHLNKIAKDGVKAKALKPQYPSMTFPNHYSIITGLYPEHHGIIANNFENSSDNKSFNLRPPTVNEAIWYRGEAFWETARRYGIISASYFWPGSEMDIDYRRPNYYKTYEHNRPYEQRVISVLDWLQLPDSSKPRFITLYFDETDSKAHRNGTTSDSLNAGIKRVDDMVAMLDSGLKSLNIIDKVNLIVVSDHGMTDMYPDRMIMINELIGDEYNFVKFINHSSLGWLIVKDKDKINSIYNRLKSVEKGFKVYLKKDIPDRFNYKKHPFIGDILIIPDLGWSLRDKKGWDSNYVSTHGYDNEEIDMHGLFIARGPAFKVNYQVGILNNLDIYPLLCRIFDINPATKIDGDLMRIIHLLKE